MTTARTALLVAGLIALLAAGCVDDAAQCANAAFSYRARCTGNVTCTHGEDPLLLCRRRTRCIEGEFVPLEGIAIRECRQRDAGTCPAAAPVAGEGCEGVGVLCEYPGALCQCWCSTGTCGRTGTWRCAPPPADPACPPRVPNLGTACASWGLRCEYGFSAPVECQSGIWVERLR